ncbi:hypothetical protein HpCHC75_06890 [Helicobacter pylori]
MGLKGENDFKTLSVFSRKIKENEFCDRMRAKTIKRSLKNPFFKKNAKMENNLTP